jgi:glycosyltransferase involved in cell wall biosynthesis
MAGASARGRPIRRRFDGADILHFPLSVMIPPVSGVPAVSTVLDVQHEELPEFFSRAELAYRRRVYGWTVRRSELVVTISHHAAEAIVEHLGVPADKVRVVHLGIDHERFTPGPQERGEFVLYPARAWPHKNHARLFEAFALLRRDRPGLELVLTGYEGATPEGVRSLGRVSEERLVQLYRTAAALAFPSLYEGFGQPPLEAMACGCPVACSNAASLPEVCGDAARLFDPRSVAEIAEAIDDAIRRSEELAALGLARAAQFTWEATAAAHDAVYRDAAS